MTTGLMVPARTAPTSAETRTASSEWPLWGATARLVVTEPGQLDTACRIADELLTRVDAAASRFRSDSELQRASAHLASGVEVSGLLAGIVRQALGAAEQTDGDVDPTLGYALDAVGYDRDIRLIEDDGMLVRAVSSRRPGWRSVSLVGTTLRVPAHLALDLGATSKALAADWVAHAVSSQLGIGVLVSLGGDIATAGEAPADGWNVLVQDTPDDPAQTVGLGPGWAMATSSTMRRRWMKGHQPQHHILDPRTGRPAEPIWRSVTIVDRSCVRANTLTTAAIVRGIDALGWLHEIDVPSRLVDAYGRVTTLGSWPSHAHTE